MGEKLVIARIMHGGLIHRQGLLKVGDVVKEVNGEVVSSMQPVELQTMLVWNHIIVFFYSTCIDIGCWDNVHVYDYHLVVHISHALLSPVLLPHLFFCHLA